MLRIRSTAHVIIIIVIITIITIIIIISIIIIIMIMCIIDSTSFIINVAHQIRCEQGEALETTEAARASCQLPCAWLYVRVCVCMIIIGNIIMFVSSSV